MNSAFSSEEIECNTKNCLPHWTLKQGTTNQNIYFSLAKATLTEHHHSTVWVYHQKFQLSADTNDTNKIIEKDFLLAQEINISIKKSNHGMLM